LLSWFLTFFLETLFANVQRFFVPLPPLLKRLGEESKFYFEIANILCELRILFFEKIIFRKKMPQNFWKVVNCILSLQSFRKTRLKKAGSIIKQFCRLGRIRFNS